MTTPHPVPMKMQAVPPLVVTRPVFDFPVLFRAGLVVKARHGPNQSLQRTRRCRSRCICCLSVAGSLSSIVSQLQYARIDCTTEIFDFGTSPRPAVSMQHFIRAGEQVVEPRRRNLVRAVSDGRFYFFVHGSMANKSLKTTPSGACR